MKVVITVKRLVEYSSIVEMPENKFKQLQADLEGSDRAKRKAAEKSVNLRIDVKDWQDDELHSVETFEEFKDE